MGRVGNDLTATYSRKVAPTVAAGPSVIVRTYRGRNQQAAAQELQKDAAKLANDGFFPVAQSWAPGQWGCGAFLIALVLFVVLVGIVAFIYMLLVKPDGTLTVTFQRREEPVASAAPAPEPRATSLDLLQSLAAMRDQGLITPEEFEAKKAELLRAM